MGGQKVVKNDKCMGVSNYWVHVPGLPPKVYAYDNQTKKLAKLTLWTVVMVTQVPIFCSLYFLFHFIVYVNVS